MNTNWIAKDARQAGLSPKECIELALAIVEEPNPVRRRRADEVRRFIPQTDTRVWGTAKEQFRRWWSVTRRDFLPLGR